MGGTLARTWASIPLKGCLHHSGNAEFYFQELSRTTWLGLLLGGRARLAVGGMELVLCIRPAQPGSCALPSCSLGGRSQEVPGGRGQGYVDPSPSCHLLLLSPHSPVHRLRFFSAERWGQRAFWSYWPHSEHFGDLGTLFFSHGGHSRSGQVMNSGKIFLFQFLPS